MSDLFEADFAPAIFSPCRLWRYRLERRWGPGRPAAFILLNPSTADETQDDPTIRRCIAFSKAWAHGGLILGNIFGFRSTDPAGLRQTPDPVGPGNDDALRSIAASADRVICGWGAHGDLHGRGAVVLDELRSAGVPLFALKLTAAGHPGHPLYLPAASEPFTI